MIVGDICTTDDADRLSVTGAPVVQINTDDFGGDCHLAAHVIEKAADEIDLDIDLLIVENVGNLVCPAEFDIGEDARVVVLSVTEGEDKPLKYPLMFRQCRHWRCSTRWTFFRTWITMPRRPATISARSTRACRFYRCRPKPARG